MFCAKPNICRLGSSFRLKSKDEGALGNQSFLRNGSGIDLGDEEEEEDEDEDDDEDEELMMMNHELAVVKPVGRNQR